MVTVSLLINAEIFFDFSVHQNNVNSFLSYETGDYPFYSTSINFKNEIKVLPYGTSSRTPFVLSGLRYARVILVDVLYIIVCILADLKLFIFVREKIRKKNAMTHEQELGDVVQVVSTPVGLNRDRIKSHRLEMKNRRKDIILKNRITGIIVLNGVNFVIFRLPSVVLSLMLLFFSYDFNTLSFEPSQYAYTFCVVYRFCDLIQELALLFYFFSFLLQFFILFKLDNNLKEEIRLMFKFKKANQPSVGHA